MGCFFVYFHFFSTTVFFNLFFLSRKCELESNILSGLSGSFNAYSSFVQWGSASMNFLLIHQLTNVTNVVLLFSDLHVLLLEDLLILLQKQDDKLVLKCLSTTFSAGYQDVKVSSSKYPSNQY